MTLLVIVSPSTSFGGGSATPQINFLNPSSFAVGAADSVMLSDRVPSRPRTGPDGYRISAWIANAPTNAGVEFELLSNGVALETLDAVTPVGDDTFDYGWDVPDTLPDGPYTLRATLFSNNEAIDNDEVDITIARLGDRATVDYPTVSGDPTDWPGDGSFGTFRPLAVELPDKGLAKRGKPVGNVDASHTVGTELNGGTTRVRSFYTISKPGTEPAWIACGTEKTPGHPVPSSAANDGVRCTLQDPRHQTRVTAVAVLPNSSPHEWEDTANGAGDAVRVFNSYRQVPTDFGVTEGNNEVITENPGGAYPCTTIVADLKDQMGREIAGANIDLHSTGPSDKFRIDTGLAPHSGILPADRNHELTEPGYDCFSDSDQSLGDQSEHQILGGSDIKHAEADIDGTSDAGEWGFSFRVPAGQVNDQRWSVNSALWVDERSDGCRANEDVLTSNELFALAQVGLDQAPAPTSEPFVASLERCDRLPALRAIALESNKTQVREGGKVDFSGAITGPTQCVRRQHVRLRTRAKATGDFRTIDSVKTNNAGVYKFDDVRVNRTRQFRTNTPGHSACVKAGSNIVKVTATR